MRWKGSRSMATLKASRGRCSRAHTDAERSDLGTTDVDARGALAAFGTDVPLGQRIDEGLLDAAHVVADPDPQPRQAQQRMNHDLAGTW